MKPLSKDVKIEAIKAFRDILVAALDAAATNPIMATSMGLMPYVLLAPLPYVGPGAVVAGAAVGAVAGVTNIPNFAISLGPLNLGFAAAQAKWPAQINIIRTGNGQKSTMTKEKEEEFDMLQKVLLAKSVVPTP